MRNRLKYIFFATIVVFFSGCTNDREDYEQPKLEAKESPIITIGNYQFKDLNKNGELDPYEDWRLSDEERILNIVSLMTLEEKAGLMFHPSFDIPEDGHVRYDLTEEERQEFEGQPMNAVLLRRLNSNPTVKLFVEEKKFRCLLNNGVADPETFANWSNQMQEFAEASRLGIPIMFSSDPRHGATLGAHVRGTQYFSRWPSIEGQLGIAAARDTSLLRKYGEITAQEYRAVGLHMILGPQIDVTTEPRWWRNAGSFSESAELTAEMLEKYMEGAQNSAAGPDKILVMLKHWPGVGPHKDGDGDWVVYPGDNFDYHLIPWHVGFSNGAQAVMGHYSGTYFDTLAVNFSSYISTEVLKNQLGFDGVLCTDWFAISRTGPLRNDLIGIPFVDRFEISINAGVHQFGGESDPDMIVELVNEGRIPKSMIDDAASRILKWHFMLGLFEDPYVNPEDAGRIVNSAENDESGYRAQLESVVMLLNDGTLPFGNTSQDPSIYIEGIDSTLAAQYAQIAESPEQADLAILQVWAESYRGRNSQKEEGDITFPEETLERIQVVAGTGVPTIVAVNLDGPLVIIPEELISATNAVFMLFDVQDEAFLDVVFGDFNPVGKLPFEIPSSMEAVRNQLEDVPFDSENPIFPYGYGLSYE